MARVRTLLLMASAMLLGYLPWYNFSAVLPLLMEEYGFSSAQAGTVLAVFQLGYVVSVLFTGWLSDKVGRKWVVAVGTLLAGAFSLAFGLFADDYGSILILRLLVGMSCGGIYAPGMALLSGWFPEGRGHALGAYTGALTASYALTYLVASPVAAAHGWRAGVVWTSLPSLAASALVLFVREGGTVGGEVVRSLPAEPQEGFFESSPAPLITGAYMGHMYSLYAFWGWIGPFLVSSAMAAGVERAAALSLGGRLATASILMGAFAPWLLGLISDRVGRTRSAAICLACEAPLLLLGSMQGLPLAHVAAVSLWIGFWIVADSAVYKAGLTELVAPRARTTGLAIQSALGFGVTIISPQMVGWVLDATNRGAPSPVAWGSAFAALEIGPVLGIIALAVLRRHPASVLMADGKR